MPPTGRDMADLSHESCQMIHTPDALALALAIALGLVQQPPRAAVATPSRPLRLASPHWSISRVQAKLLPRPESSSPIGTRQGLRDDGQQATAGRRGQGRRMNRVEN